MIAPSLLSANFLRLHDEVEMINSSSADWFHLDVMDGCFVPNISFGLPVIAAVKKLAQKPLDVHLMIVQPENYLEAFCKAGADILTLHYEASIHLHRSLQAIKALGMKAGVALNPHTPVAVLQEVLHEIDVVCIMSVNPGFGGQKFIERTYNKIVALKQMIADANSNTLIEIDGGVTLDNAQALYNAGADVLVAGNTVFSSPNPILTIHALKSLKGK